MGVLNDCHVAKCGVCYAFGMKFARSGTRFGNIKSVHDVSRFCSGQSINDQQGSIREDGSDVSMSIKSSYFQQISTGFNKSFDLFWEQTCLIFGEPY
jgi:hypothetical protein